MSYHDQEKYLELLKRNERKLDKKELEEYKMFSKMHKDDEDFDSVSLKRLKELYDKYNVHVDTSMYDKYFKKQGDT
jgi:transposase